MDMRLIQSSERAGVEAISALAYCNPFLEERIELERQALGPAFTPADTVWHPGATAEGPNPNPERIARRAGELAETLRARLIAGTRGTDAERGLYRDVCVYVLYDQLHGAFEPMVTRAKPRGQGPRAPFYAAFATEVERLLGLPGVGLPAAQTPAQLFACMYQVRRAFHHTFLSIAGGSLPAARLRAQVWQSILTHDVRRYLRALYDRMGDVTTLVTGPSGAGKELVARAIGLSRYIPFDAKTLRFEADTRASFFPLNLSALSPTLIESELFGHRRGAFTGAVADRKGWLAVCPPVGTVFLDEIGEIDAGIQVKLLRVIETRTFQPLGSSRDRRFEGKIVAATNRDLGREMTAGRFREDLYYRLCADTVVAPSLRERLDDAPEELATLLGFLAERLIGAAEAGALAAEAEAWIEANLGRAYPWPGNVRELSHCLSNVMIHRNYQPAQDQPPDTTRERIAREFVEATQPADEMLRRYATLAFARTGSYVQAGQQLGLDRRTVKRYVDPALLAALRARNR